MKIGEENKKGQKKIGDTDLPGNSPNQRISVMECLECGNCYGANGCDAHLRKCKCIGGKPCSNPVCDNGNCPACKWKQKEAGAR